MVTTRPPKTIVKPTALGPVANTDTKLLIYGLFQKGRVLAQDAVGPSRRSDPDPTRTSRLGPRPCIGHRCVVLADQGVPSEVCAEVEQLSKSSFGRSSAPPWRPVSESSLLLTESIHEVGAGRLTAF